MTIAVTFESPATTLHARIQEALLRSRCLGRSSLLTHVEKLRFTPDPLAFLEVAAGTLGHGALWWQPATGTIFAGAGAAVEFRADGPGRFGEAVAAARAMRTCLVPSGEAATLPWIGGFAFGNETARGWPWQDFPGALLTIPRVLLQIADSVAFLRVTIEVSPHAVPAELEAEVARLIFQGTEWSQTLRQSRTTPSILTWASVPDRTAWEGSVATAISLIRQGAIDKVVLAREERLGAEDAFNPFETLARLREADGSAILFALESHGSWFLGATPERLVRLQAGHVDVSCLAGSSAIGETSREQSLLAGQLLANPKDREEHEIVVRSTMAALADICDVVVRAPETPRVVAARSVLHLESPVTARLAAAGHVLDLVERLHPTPAVGGFPRCPALHLMHELERIDRGWYAGPFGWMDLDGSGEFAVAIRSALLSGRTASLFAGCGIVADSEPAREFVETDLKLRPMLSALGAS